MATKTDQLCLAWTGDYESLKRFLVDSLKLEGIWSQPGGDKKVFEADDCSISWRKNSKLLYIEGERGCQVEREMMECFLAESDEPVQPCVDAHSCNSPNISAEIEELKAGQSVNRETIKALADSVSYMAGVLSQIQNRKGNDESPQCSEVKQISGDETAKQITSTNAQLAAEVTSSDLQVPVIDLVQEHAEPLTRELVNDFILSLSVDNNNVNEHVKVNEHVRKQSLINDGDFKGVSRRQSKTKHFFLSRISEDVKKEQISSYLKNRNVEPTNISIFNSRQRGTIFSES